MGFARSARVRALRALVAGVVLAVLPIVAATADAAQNTLRADLDGQPMKVADVGNWYCHDFDYPTIHCFRDAASLEAAVKQFVGADTAEARIKGSGTKATATSTTAINYVVVYDFTTYAGAYMYMSQDYTVLATIGWSDRISSFVGLNSQAGVFWTDWFYSGNRYSFCCNQAVPSLGSSYDNSFSSVFRN